jgi:hypothetical protein
MEKTTNFTFTIDGAPYIVKAEASYFNSELQYTVNINDADEVLFIFNSDLGRYAPVGENAVDVPDDLEIAIGTKLNGLSLQN